MCERSTGGDFSTAADQAEILLGEIEALYASPNLGVCLIGTDLRYQRINECLAELNGASVAAHLGRTPREVTSALGEQLEPLCRRVLETGEALVDLPLSGEIPSQSGCLRSFLASFRPVRSPVGELLGVLAIAREVTGQRRAEAAISELAATYKAIFESVNDVIIVHDLDTGAIVDCNPKVTEVFGRSIEETCRFGVAGLSSGVSPYTEKEAHQLLRLAAEDKPQLFEWHCRDRNGRLFWAEINLKRADIGGFPRIMAVLRDVTERKQAEEVIAAENAFSRAVIECASEGLCVFHSLTDFPHVQFTVWNRCMIEITGYTMEDINRLGWYESLYPDPVLRRRAQERVERMRLGDNSRAERSRITRADGQVRTVSISTSIVQAAPDAVHVLAVLQDVTEQEFAAEELRAAVARRDWFLAVLGHELRNPLASLRNAVQILRLPDRSEAAMHGAVEIIDRQVGHTTRLVDDLLDASRLTHGRITLHKERLDLNVLVCTIVTEYPTQVATDHVELAVEPAAGQIWVDGDATRLTQILGNLLSNAVKFTPAGGRIVVSTRVVDRKAVLSVRDTGIGIAPELQGRLFQPFVQASESLDRSAMGLGLGLAISKGLAELHGGTLQVSSDGLGAGSCFDLTLALAPAPIFRQRPLTAAAPARCRVLIIEDNVDVAGSLRLLLTLKGHEVEVTFDGPSGVKAACSGHHDVIICDIGLPGGMSGYDVAERLHAELPVPLPLLVALTGYGQERDRQRALAAGFDFHLTKPVCSRVVDEVLATVRQR